MHKTIFGGLSIITLTMLIYTGLTIYDESQKVAAPVASIPSQIVATSTLEKTLTTSTGKIIKILETNPLGESMSTIKLSPSGFFLNDVMTLEKNKLTSYFLADLNNDKFDELILITTVQGSGNYGDVTIFTTAQDSGLAVVTVPQLLEDDMQPGGLFEGYMGHDTFKLENSVLTREYPTYNKEDTDDTPTGPSKKLTYKLIESNGIYSIKITKDGDTASSTTAELVAGLFGTTWIWTDATVNSKPITVPTGEKFVLSFNKDMSVTSLTDCNTVQSGLLISGTSTIKFGLFSSTKKVCQKSREAEYVKLLTEVTSYTIDKSTLTLKLGTTGTLQFKQK